MSIVGNNLEGQRLKINFCAGYRLSFIPNLLDLVPDLSHCE